MCHAVRATFQFSTYLHHNSYFRVKNPTFQYGEGVGGGEEGYRTSLNIIYGKDYFRLSLPNIMSLISYYKVRTDVQ